MRDALRGLEEEIHDLPPFHVYQLAPVALFAGLLGVSFLVYPVRTQDFGLGYLLYFIPPFGKESIVPALVSTGFDRLFVAGAIMVMDLVGALIVFTNWHLLVRIPLVGPVMQRFSDRLSDAAGPRTALKGAGGVFLFFWVMFPLQGSGGISAALLSRVFGMSIPVALAIIGTAAFTSALFIGTVTEFALQLVDPIFVLAAVAVVAGAVGLRYLVGFRRGAEEE